MARPTSSEVPGWASWALTTTGQPAASAEAVSPPATEKASGKLLAPKTATGPSGMERWRMSGRGNGVRSGSAGSMRAPFQLPSRRTPANSSKLSGRAADLTGEAGLRQSAFGDGALDEGVLGGLEIGGDRLEELGALLGGRRPVVGEGGRSGGAGGFDVCRVAVEVCGLEFLACGGIEGTDLLAGTPNGFTGDEHLSRQHSVGHRGSHGIERRCRPAANSLNVQVTGHGGNV